uniref:Ubiquinone biosynthesis accessory factor UbiJ n=1 Tax=Methylobacillus rhizosphaerae TaxID=551994 RepID=A0A239AEV2_9PROT|nr:SCP2 sterol-binding domain-containing protein [Methylobacillus rhizosphaerae]SNR93558.1 ubiquinone biosynthesis protein UbiJ [Methylobacillus rhizosphaerae]
MLKLLLNRLLNHLLAQNSWANDVLQPFAGQHARLALPPVSAMLTVLEDGGLAVAGETADADATITTSPSLALRILAGDDTAGNSATITGDTELASALGKVLQGISWEYEEDLSRVIGDIPAHEIVKFGRHAVSEVKHQTLNMASMLTEYWQEEQPLIAKKRHIEQFVRDVDTLHEDTERLQKRIRKLEARLLANH